MSAKVLAIKTQAKHLRPGDLYSPLGPNYWRTMMNERDIAATVYIRTNVPLQDGLDDEVFKLVVEIGGSEKGPRTVLDPHMPPGAK